MSCTDAPAARRANWLSVRRRGRLWQARGGAGGSCASGGLWLVMVVVLLGGCSESSRPSEGAGQQPQQTTRQPEAEGAAARGSDEAAGAVADPRELSITELNDGPGVLELGVSELLGEVGVLEFLEGYVINVPPTAEFISRFEVAKAQLASHYMHLDAGDAGDIVGRFEANVLYHSLAGLSSLSEVGGSEVLHEEFFAVLEECGRESRWPDVELFVMAYGQGYDIVPDDVEPMFGLSYFEYQQLKHECARYAATYPGLDEAVIELTVRSKGGDIVSGVPGWNPGKLSPHAASRSGSPTPEGRLEVGWPVGRR